MVLSKLQWKANASYILKNLTLSWNTNSKKCFEHLSGSLALFGFSVLRLQYPGDDINWTYFSPSSLLRLIQVPSFSQAPLVVLNYIWSHNPPTYWTTVTLNWYCTHTVSKLCLLNSWVSGACHYVLCPKSARKQH